jgi:MarR-like DNA-binding transcriptional regulator SgrR of sgrS sRNA
MKELGLTQAQLADRSGLSQQIISNYINNKFKPGYDAILALSEALEVKPEWFFDESAIPTEEAIALGKIQRGGTLRIGHLLPMDNLLPPASLDNGMEIIENLYWLSFDKLVRVDTSSGLKAGISYNWKRGEKYWIFDLFDGITFHDGQTCTAEDVEYSYHQWMSYNEESNPIKTTQVIDTYTFLLELKKEGKISDIPMPFIVPRGSGNSKGNFVGTGPFKAVEIQPDFWRLQAHNGHCHRCPFLDEVVVKSYQNRNELENAIINEQMDIAVGIDLDDERFNVQSETTVQKRELPVTYVKNLRALENRVISMTRLDDIHTWYFESKTELIQFPQRTRRSRIAQTSISRVV